MPYLTHTLARVPLDPTHPLGIDVIKTEYATLAEAVAAPGTTGAIFCDELTIGRTMIREESGRWVNDYANPERAAI